MRTLFDDIPEPVSEPAAIDIAKRFTPRPYQAEAQREFFRLDAVGVPGAIIRLNTGGGKTFLGSWIAQEWINRSPDHYAIVIAHERQLVTQFAEEIQDLLEIPVGIEMADDGNVTFGHRFAPKIIVASRQTLMEDANGNSRLYKFDWNKNWLQIFDECHRWAYGLKSCRHIVDWFEQNPNSRRLGLTATPERSDGVSLRRIFPGVALDYRMHDLNGGPSAVNDGWAVAYDQRFVQVSGVDFKNIKQVAGDFRSDDLDDILRQKEQLDSLIVPTLDLVGTRRTIIFNPGVKMAQAVADAINSERSYRLQNGLECEFGEALSISGETPEEIRRHALHRHQSGQVQFLSVCGLCREGYNDPNIQAVAIFRPTKSRSLAEQMKGRGCRPLKGLVDGLETTEERKAAIAASEKPNCMVIDLVGVSGLADVASTAHVMAEGKPDEVIERANQNAIEQAKTGAVDMEEEILKAEQQLHREAEKREAERKARIRSQVNYSQRSVRAGDTVAPVETNQRTVDLNTPMPFGKFKGKRIRDLPEQYLHWGVKEIRDRALKSAFQKSLNVKQGQYGNVNLFGPASETQKRALQKHGYSTDVTYGEAAQIILKQINPQLTGAK